MRGTAGSDRATPARSGSAPKRLPLSRRRVLEGALALVERDGAESLTMRRLGRHLGVEAMSLYNHVENRDAVLDGIGELLAEELAAEEASAEGWEEAALAFARRIRATATRRPEAFRLVALRPLVSATALAPTESLLGRLRAAGFSPADTLAGYRLLVSYGRGYALAEMRGFTLDVAAFGEGGIDLVAEGLPEIAALMGTLSSFDVEAVFETGLQALLTGLRARLDA